jgi:hypothetical protein
MNDFQKNRDALRQLRGEYESARLNWFAANQKVRLLQKELDSLERRKGDNDEDYLIRRRELIAQIEHEKRTEVQHRGILAHAKDQLQGAEKLFQLFIDPRRELSAHFSNETPFLLFPLRMETRFKTVNNKPQLWVRVYPDECLVDSFEPLLSRKEVANAARFWAEYYSAGKPADPANPDPATVDLQKAAWRLLVSAHGDGRAAWITRQLRPDEAKSIFPVRGPKTVILAIASDEWESAHQSVIIDLFKELWSAYGNSEATENIKKDFNAANPDLVADKIIATYQPVNFDEKLPDGLTRDEADLQIAIVAFQDFDKKIGKENSWSQPTRVNLLPERLALIRFKNGQPMNPIFGNPIPFPLQTSPDPAAEEGPQLQQNDEAEIEFAEPIRWLADFDKAVDIGMGFRIDLAADEVDGFNRLLVLGVRLGSDADNGKKGLEELFEHHYYSKKGFTLIPQGTPTNNTESSDSGFTHRDKADETFDLYFNNKPAFEETGDWSGKSDGQWLAEWLGLDYPFFKKCLYSNSRDQSDARNMNTALWPATIGYVMESLMQGGFSPEVIEHTRTFFNAFVIGRGPFPAVRIGNQPYGILPTAAFGRLRWMETDNRLFVRGRDSHLAFLNNLYQLLLRMETYWHQHFFNTVAHVAQASTDAYKTLLDVLSLHPNSAEFHRRYMESLIEMSNSMSLIKPGYKEHAKVVKNAVQLLHETLNYGTDVLPQIAALLALPWQKPVAHLIDDVPLSESKAIRSYTADKKNYIEALSVQAAKSIDALRTGEGLSERPDAELYRLLKYALEQGYYLTAVGAAKVANAFSETKLSSMKLEQPFAHQQWKGEVAESRYALLYGTVPQISTSKTVGQYVRDSVSATTVPLFARYLSQQLKALKSLQNASTARLERAFVEHLDCCSYRLDAWKTAILTNQLVYMRNNGSGGERQHRTGIFLGAYGWVENVHPNKKKQLATKELTGDLTTDFNPDRTKVFLSDPTNEGYIHAPSLNQGITAAVLRNGYVSHGKQDGNNVLSVNLTSERIRLALSIIEGIQGGQSLAALLGYRFERELHNRNDLKAKGIDKYIYPLRKAFPLAADQLKETKVANSSDPSVDPDTVPITAIEARNVVHGINLINYVKKQTLPANKIYPFGLNNFPNNDAAIGSAITDAVAHIMDVADAVADLGIAESVHHVLMGNYDRAAGVLESYSKGNYPQEPDVIRTPRSGATLTHRVSIPLSYVPLAAGAAPRVQAEPSINQWLTKILPPLNKIVCQCSYKSRASGEEKNLAISLQDIGLQPIDLLYMVNVTDIHAMNELDDRFIHRLQTNAAFDPMIDRDIVLNYTQDAVDPANFTVFQVMPLVKSLRALLVESASLTPGDVALPNEITKKDVPAPELPAQRVKDLKEALEAILKTATDPGGVVNELVNLPDLATTTEAQRKTIRHNADDILNRFALFLLQLADFGIPQTGSGALYQQRQLWFVSLKKKVKEAVDRWQKKSDDYALLGADPAPSNETLQKMERLVSTDATPIETITKAIVKGKKDSFDFAFKKLADVLTTNQPTIGQLLQDIEALDTTPYDLVALDLAKDQQQIVQAIYDLVPRAKTLVSDIQKNRIQAVQAILDTLNALAPDAKVKQTEAAARLILGDQFRMIPRYPLPIAQQSEIANSWNNMEALLDYAKNKAKEKHTNPTEDWLHGMARVDEKIKHLENCLLLRDAFGLDGNDFAIHPAQFPFKNKDYNWIALSFPDDDDEKKVSTLEKGNTLLYTAFTAKDTVAPTEICGLLINEWIERIPEREETTGITFHYDRPNQEAPQTMLLVTPTELTGNWQWNDLVDALVYTLDAARLRGVEPAAIDKTSFATFLPAIVAAESLHPYSIVLDNKAHYAELVKSKN